MRLLVCLLALCALPALAGDAPPPPPPPPPPPSDSPATTTTPPDAPPSGEVPAVEAKARTNWARPAAFIGFGIGAGVLSLSIVAQIVGSGLYSSFGDVYFAGGSYLMLGAFALTAAGGPVIQFGARSARWTKSITGSNGLRITGWIGYGVGLFIQFLSWFSPYLPLLGGLVGAGALTCFGIDALFSANEAADVATMASADDGVRLRPTISLLRSADGRFGGGAVLGMSGSF